jgi:hypothetical protein
MKCLAIIVVFTSLVFQASSQSKTNTSKNEFWANVHLIDRTQLQGLWHSSTVDEIIIRQGDETIHLNPEQIYTIEIKNVNKTKRSSILGAAIGFTIGAIIGATDSDNDARDGYAEAGYILGTGLLGAFGGGFVGFVIGMNGKTYYVLGKSEQYRTIQPSLLKYNRQD